MSGLTNYFKNLNVCEDFKNAKLKAKENGIKYVSPCEIEKNSGFLAYVKNIPFRLREFGCFMSHSFKKSWKLRFITLFLIILYCVNYYLIQSNQITSSNKEGGNAINTLYFTTTQVSSVGFGDWTPATGFAKLISSLANILIIFTAYSIVEEFGYVTVARAKQTEDIKKNIKEDLAPLHFGLSPEIQKTIKDNIVKKLSTVEPVNITDIIKTANTINKTERGVNRAKDQFLKSINKNNKVYSDS
jgi:hypothetical protein